MNKDTGVERAWVDAGAYIPILQLTGDVHPSNHVLETVAVDDRTRIPPPDPDPSHEVKLQPEKVPTAEERSETPPP